MRRCSLDGVIGRERGPFTRWALEVVEIEQDVAVAAVLVVVGDDEATVRQVLHVGQHLAAQR